MFKKIIEFFTGGKIEEGTTAFEQDVNEQATTPIPKPNTGDEDIVEED